MIHLISLNIDVETATQLTGHTHGQFEGALDEIRDLFVTHGKKLGVSNVALDIYKHRDIVMSLEKHI